MSAGAKSGKALEGNVYGVVIHKTVPSLYGKMPSGEDAFSKTCLNCYTKDLTEITNGERRGMGRKKIICKVPVAEA